MLLALSAQEGQDLQERAAMLQSNGIKATYHSQAAVAELEPALQLPQAGGALLVESDSQLVRAAHMQCKSNVVVRGTTDCFRWTSAGHPCVSLCQLSLSKHLDVPYSILTCHSGHLVFVLHVGSSCGSDRLRLPLAVAMLQTEHPPLVHLALILNLTVCMVPPIQCIFMHTCAQQPLWKAAVDILV